MINSKAAKAAKAAIKALRQSNNEWSNKYFAIAIGAIMVLFAIHHWSSVLHFHYGPKRSNSTLNHGYRAARRFLSSSVVGLRTGRSVLYIIYWAINLILSVTNVDLTNLSYVAKRIGWISVANIVLLVFLALKNTPLAPLTARSYEKLRPLHKVAGYTCIFTSCVHGVVYLNAWSESGSLWKMQKTKNFAGSIAGMAMLIIGLSTITFFMRRFYELSYMLHIIMFMLILIMVGMYRPQFSSSTVIIVIFTACLWILDRLIRGAKIIWNVFQNSATVTALPNNAIRVKLTRGIQCRPGSHAFLWVPAVRLIETHPFTMLSSKPTEFVIRVYDGFTHDLYKAAQKAPGRSLRCSVDGGYGQVPNFRVFDRAVLVAGGSGASFTFSVALNLVEEAASKIKAIDFIWVVRRWETLQWFAHELKQLQNHPNVSILLHVTGETDLSSTPSPTPPRALSEKDSVNENPARDLEKGACQNTSVQTSPSIDIRPGRPDIDNIIAAAVASSGNPEDRIIVGACGPGGLMDTIREAVGGDLYDGGPSITLYTEEFEW